MIMLAAMLKSIEKNHKSGELLRVYVVDDHISERKKRKLEASLDRDLLQLHWIPIRNTIPEGMNFPLVPNTYPLNTYVRLFIPYFMPQGIEKVLFMDVDMLVLDDISKLWHTDIGAHAIGAVTDSITKTIGNVGGDGIENWQELGLDKNAPFFNAGLQLINIREWKRQGITEKVLNCINENRKYARMGDQYGLNVVFAGRYFKLDPLWNYLANGNHPSPYLVHFIHRKPFYRSYFNNLYYRKLFYEYLGLTRWKRARPVGEPRRYLKKLNNVFQKVNLFFDGREKGRAATVPSRKTRTFSE